MRQNNESDCRPLTADKFITFYNSVTKTERASLKIFRAHDEYNTAYAGVKIDDFLEIQF